MATAFVSKSRRVRFELTVRILDLNNVPLVSGTSFIKWHLPASTAAEHRGRTNKAPIKDHRVQYDYEKSTQVRLVVGKDGQLQECRIEFEVLQEYSKGGRGERIALGNVRLNLAEYADAAEERSPGGGAHAAAAPGGGRDGGEDEGITRRYLMQDSKINSTLKIGISLRHVDGTKDYSAPPLRTAPVFGGIAGIMSSSEPVASTPHGVASHVNGEAAATATPSGEDAQALPAMPNFSSTSKEMGEMQDMYRRTLAAFWASQPGELKADECVEDIFAGGDGWGKAGRPTSAWAQYNSESGSPPSEAGDKMKMADLPHRRNFSKSSHHHHHHHKMRPRKGPGELEEMDVREDLVSWQIGERACS